MRRDLYLEVFMTDYVVRCNALLAIIAGCGRLDCYPTVAMLEDALKESRDKQTSQDPLYGLPAKHPTVIRERLEADLSALQHHALIELKDGSYYRLSGRGVNAVTEIFAPVWTTEVVARTILRRAQFSHPLF